MGRRTAKCHVDSQDYKEKINRGDSVCISIQCRGCIPLEVGLPTTRTTEFDVEENECSLRKDLNLIDERTDIATIRLASYQHQMKRGHDKNIRPRSFQVGDLVLRKLVANTRNPNDGKLGPNWEGPYKVTSFARVGAYRLTDLNGKSVLRPWNICNLKKYFF